MRKENPYYFAAGADLDAMIHLQVFGGLASGICPTYSVSDDLAKRVQVKLIKRFKIGIVTGKTTLRIPSRRFFARWETGPSTSTEVLAESIPLAICRLAILITDKHND